MTNDINMWKLNSRIATIGFSATVALGFSMTPQLGKDVNSPYLFDDLTIVSLLMFGTLFSAIGSYWHKKTEEKIMSLSGDEHEQHDQLERQKADLFPFSMFGAGCLLATAIYAFDVAFLGGSLCGSPRPNAGPDSISEKVIYSALYSFVALAGLLVAYAEGKSLMKSVGNPLMMSRSEVINYSNNRKDFTPYMI